MGTAEFSCTALGAVWHWIYWTVIASVCYMACYVHRQVASSQSTGH